MPARRRAAVRRRPQGRSGRRALEHLCRPRRDPLLPAAQCPVAERFLRPGGDRGQGCRGPRAPASQAEKLLAEEFPSVVARISPLELGPPVGWPMQYRVSGPDVERSATSRLSSRRPWPPIRKPPTSISTGSSRLAQVRIRIDQDEARLLGLSSQALASVLSTVISGAPITQVRDDIYLVDVVLRATDEQRVSLDSLRSIQVPLPNGATVPLGQFATFEYVQDYPLIVSSRPYSDTHRPGRCRAWDVAGIGDDEARAADRGVAEELAAGLPDRRRRYRGGKCQVAGLGRRRRADHDLSSCCRS